MGKGKKFSLIPFKLYVFMPSRLSICLKVTIPGGLFRGSLLGPTKYEILLIWGRYVFLQQAPSYLALTYISLVVHLP